MRIGTIVTFSMSHRLRNYKGCCALFHGHDFKLEVVVAGKVNKSSGMVVDLKSLRKVVKECVPDHRSVVEIKDKFFSKVTTEADIARIEAGIVRVGFIPTVENLVMMIKGNLDIALKKFKVKVVMLRLWEGYGGFAEWERKER